jgi:hypothetical protein
MGEMGDRIDRAERYVLGLMDEEERERAERDLEMDAAFRQAMVEMAERMHVFDHMPAAEKTPDDDWRLLKERIAAMPQMRAAPTVEPVASTPEPAEPKVIFGRRRSDRLHAMIIPETPPRTIGTGLHSVPSRRALILALALIAAFALGYAAGVSSVSIPAVTSAP